MLTRREFVSTGVRVGAGLAVGSATAFLNGCAHHVPRSAGMPTPTNQTTGDGSLKAHASAHGLLTGGRLRFRFCDPTRSTRGF
jgi:hypothetical protein